jgi:hypothetical protein
MTRPLAQQALPFLVAALLAACGGKSRSSGDDGSEGGSIASGGTASVGGSASNGGQPSKCDQLANEPGWPVSVRLVNGTKRPLYLGQETPGCGLGTLFHVGDPSGTTLDEPQACSSTCQDLAQGVSTCVPGTCAPRSVVTLQPGEAFQQVWSGSYLKEEVLPAGCPPGSQASTCSRVVAIQPGTFTFAATARTAIDCSPFGGVCTPCMVDGNGGCTTYGAVATGLLLFAVASPELDQSYGVGANGAVGHPVDVVFQE